MKSLFKKRPFVPCALHEYLQYGDEQIGSCACDPIGDCSYSHGRACWITGRKKPFITVTQFESQVAKGLVFNCCTHEWEKRKKRRTSRKKRKKRHADHH